MQEVLPSYAQEEVVVGSKSAPTLLRQPNINETPKWRSIPKLAHYSFVCVYVCMYVRMYIWMYVCVYEWMVGGWMQVCTCVCMYLWMYVCIDGWMQVCMYECPNCLSMHASKPKCMYVQIVFQCMSKCMCLHLCMYPKECWAYT